jgi:hypothetical protein
LYRGGIAIITTITIIITTTITASTAETIEVAQAMTEKQDLRVLFFCASRCRPGERRDP